MSDQPDNSEIIPDQAAVSVWRESDVVIIKQDGRHPEEDQHIHVAVGNAETFARAILASSGLDMIIKPTPKKRGGRA